MSLCANALAPRVTVTLAGEVAAVGLLGSVFVGWMVGMGFGPALEHEPSKRVHNNTKRSLGTNAIGFEEDLMERMLGHPLSEPWVRIPRHRTCLAKRYTVHSTATLE